MLPGRAVGWAARLVRGRKQTATMETARIVRCIELLLTWAAVLASAALALTNPGRTYEAAEGASHMGRCCTRPCFRGRPGRLIRTRRSTRSEERRVGKECRSRWARR